MFAAGFLWVDSGRGCLTTGRNCYTLQIHYSLILIDSPNYWRIFLEHLLCAIHRNHAASLFLGSQFIYFLLFLLLSESIFLCFESRYGFSCKSHKALQSLQWLNKKGIYLNHLTRSPGVGRPGLVQLLKDVIIIPDSLLLQHLTLVLIVTSLLLLHQALHPYLTQAEKQGKQ